MGQDDQGRLVGEIIRIDSDGADYSNVYKHGHEPFTLDKFCDGWIYTNPLSEYEPVAYIEDWINEDNLDAARANAMNPRWRELSVEQLNKGCLSYLDDHRRFYGRLR